MMTKFSALLTTLLTLGLAAQPAIAATPDEVCHFKKLIFTGKYASCRLIVLSKSVKKQTAPDYTKCIDKQVSLWGKVDNSFGTDCPADAGALNPVMFAIDSATDSIAAALPGGGLGKDSDKCEALKLKTLGKAALCRLKAEAKGIKKNEPADTQKCTDKCDLLWSKLDTKFGPNCPAGAGEQASLKAPLNSALDSVVNQMDSGGATTTTTLPPTTTTMAVSTTTTTTTTSTTNTTTTTSTTTSTTLYPADAQVLFITSTSYDGSFGGITAADQICADRATAAGLPGTYLAWISTNGVSPAARFYQGPGSIYAPSGVLLASNWNLFRQGLLLRAPQEDEFGTASDKTAWTGTATNGTALPQTCLNWSSTNSTGWYGEEIRRHSHWTQFDTGACHIERGIYCMSQQ